MTAEEKKQITKIAKEFTQEFREMFGGINGTGWLMVDPLSAYLSAIGFENKLHQLPETDDLPQVLIMTFEDGTQFIPAGKDLKPINPKAKNWMWL